MLAFDKAYSSKWGAGRMPYTEQHLDSDGDNDSDRLKELHLRDFVTYQDELDRAEPRELAVPYLWKWRDVSPLLDRVHAGRSLDKVRRRSLSFSNPGLGGRPFASTTMLASMSIYYPQDIASVHRHTSTASRLLLSGDGAYTTVGGEKCSMSRADLVITQNGEWHDHGNDGTEPIIWANVLDVPLLEQLNAIMTEWDYYETDPTTNSGKPIHKKAQSFFHPPGYSDELFHVGGIVPRFGPERRGRGVHTPKYIYQWSRTREVLHRLRREAGSPYDGIIVEYTNPVTGDSVAPTLAFHAQLLRASEATRTHKHTSSTIYCVIEGNGFTEVDGKRLEWEPNDVFVVPGWKWHRHINMQSTADACLYSVTDAPIHHKLCIYREIEKTEKGKSREIHPWPSRPEPDSRVPGVVDR
jgi:gentisate 1,2-dioxygenase